MPTRYHCYLTYINLALDDRNLYMSDSSDIVWAFNLENGQVQWKQAALAARELTAPVMLGHYVLVGDKTGFLHVLDVQQGELLFRLSLGSAVDVAPTISDNRAYVITSAGQVMCFSVSV